MELAEVKKYFENAEKCISTFGREFIMTEEIFDGIYKDEEDFYTSHGEFCLFEESKGFAKILTTKKTSFSITKEQLRQLTDPKVKEWFPEVFEIKLEVGKWYKHFAGGFFFVKELENNRADCYGFNANNEWYDSSAMTASVLLNRSVKATEQEVFEALKNEAVKRGFVEGARITPMYSNGKDYYPDENIISKPINFKLKRDILEVAGGYDYYRIFKNGKWATIIPTITKSEAEKLLNKKIID